MTSIFEGQPPSKQGLFETKGGSFGFQVYIYIHGGPTGMVVANMAVDGPFFQPANVEGTGSRHSWL